MAILTLTSLTSATVLAVSGAIDWQPALWLAAGAALGSALASRWSIRRGHGAIRAAVLVICLLVVARLASQLIAGW